MKTNCNGITFNCETPRPLCTACLALPRSPSSRRILRCVTHPGAPAVLGRIPGAACGRLCSLRPLGAARGPGRGSS